MASLINVVCTSHAQVKGQRTFKLYYLYASLIWYMHLYLLVPLLGTLRGLPCSLLWILFSLLPFLVTVGTDHADMHRLFISPIFNKLPCLESEYMLHSLSSREKVHSAHLQHSIIPAHLLERPSHNYEVKVPAPIPSFLSPYFIAIPLTPAARKWCASSTSTCAPFYGKGNFFYHIH